MSDRPRAFSLHLVEKKSSEKGTAYSYHSLGTGPRHFQRRREKGKRARRACARTYASLVKCTCTVIQDYRPYLGALGVSEDGQLRCTGLRALTDVDYDIK